MNLFTSYQSRGSHRLGHTALHCDRTCCFSLSLLRSAKLNRTCVFQTGPRPFLYFLLYFNVMYSLYNYLSASFVLVHVVENCTDKIIIHFKDVLRFSNKANVVCKSLCVCIIQNPIKFRKEVLTNQICAHTHTSVNTSDWSVFPFSMLPAFASIQLSFQCEALSSPVNCMNWSSTTGEVCVELLFKRNELH